MENEKSLTTTKTTALALTTNENGAFLTPYSSEPASDQMIATSISVLNIAFPKMDKAFFKLLVDAAKRNGFSNERLRDAVNSVIDTHSYQNLCIADIIKFDKKARLYSWNEVPKRTDERYAKFVRAKKVNGELLYALRSELINMGMDPDEVQAEYDRNNKQN